MYEIFSKDTYQKPSRPFISPSAKLREFTFRAISQGLILGLIFGIGNIYLALKIGATTSASIAAAAALVGFNRLFFKNTTILENNISQTIASVGEGIAAGIAFTVPAFYLLYGTIPNFLDIFLLSSLGGILGILIMIALRRPIVVDEFGKYPFPEGYACAEILKTSETRKPRGRFMFFGFILGGIYKIFINGLHFLNEIPAWTIAGSKYFHLSINCSPAILAMGFIVGTRTAFLLFVGGGISWWVLNPLIHIFGQGNTIIPPGEIPISNMSADDIWFNYNRYIGAGALAVAAFLSAWKPLIKIKNAIKNIQEEIIHRRIFRKNPPRTERDITLIWWITSFFVILLILWILPPLSINILTIFLLVIFGLFFGALSSYTAGIVGTSSNPTSGFIITLILLTLLIFKLTGVDNENYIKALLTMSVAICTAISMAQTTTQDLYTGYIVGATPKYQQIGEIIGVFLPAITISGCIYLFNKTSFFGSAEMPAPQATMIALITKGFAGGISLLLLLIGGIISFLFFLVSIRSKNKNTDLHFKDAPEVSVIALAIGLYLPLFLSSPFIIGGLISGIVQHFSKSQENTIRGDIFCSGLFAGDACIGVILLALCAIGWGSTSNHSILPDFLSIISFLILGLFVIWFSLRPPKRFMFK